MSRGNKSHGSLSFYFIFVCIIIMFFEIPDRSDELVVAVIFILKHAERGKRGTKKDTISCCRAFECLIDGALERIKNRRIRSILSDSVSPCSLKQKDFFAMSMHSCSHRRHIEP